jgi:hypothetical protein
MPALVKALKRVDLPTLGKPTMPHLRLIEIFQGDRVDRGYSERRWDRKALA